MYSPDHSHVPRYEQFLCLYNLAVHRPTNQPDQRNLILSLLLSKNHLSLFLQKAYPPPQRYGHVQA